MGPPSKRSSTLNVLGLGIGLGLELRLGLGLGPGLELGPGSLFCMGELIIWAVSLLGFFERCLLLLEEREREGRREARERECCREEL